MPTEPAPITLFEVVRRAVEVCDPAGTDEALGQYLERFEDRDEPVTAIDDVVTEASSAAREIDVDELDPALRMAVAVTSYLAFRRDELNADDEHLLRLAARSEFDGEPPAAVADWLADRGVRP